MALNEITLSDGTRIKTAVPLERLADFGVTAQPALMPTLGQRGALAFGDSPERGNVPESRSDAGGGGFGGASGIDPSANFGGSSGTSPSEGTGTQPGSDVQQVAQPVDRGSEANKAEEKRRAGVERFGAERKDIPLEDPGFAPQAPPPVRYVTQRAKDIKGADIRTGYSVKKTGATDRAPEFEEQLSDTNINRKLAGQEQADATADAFEAERGAALEESIRLEEAKAQAEQRRQRAEAAIADYEARQTELDREHDELSSLKVNPDQWWDNKSTGAKILAAIGMIAGGIQSGLKGGPNQFAEFIYRAVRDDVNGQREKIEARRQGFNTKRTRLDKKAELFRGDMAAAMAELEANGLAMAAALGRKRAAESGLANVNPNMMAQFAAWDQEVLEKRMQNAQQNGAQISETWQFTPDRTVAVGGAPLNPEARKRLVTFNNGRSRGFVVADSAREGVQGKITSMENISNSLARLKAIARDASPGNLQAIRDYEAEQGILQAELNVGVGQGAISKDDAGRVEKSLPNVGDLTVSRDNAITRLDGANRWATSRRDAAVRDNVYADPDATTPSVSGQAGSYRPE